MSFYIALVDEHETFYWTGERFERKPCKVKEFDTPEKANAARQRLQSGTLHRVVALPVSTRKQVAEEIREKLREIDAMIKELEQ